MNLYDEKSDLRKKYRSLRDNIPLDQKSEADKKIFENLINLPEFAEYNNYLLYYSIKSEADTKKLSNYLIENKKKLAFPKCQNSGKMDFFYIDNTENLVISKFGIPEPQGNEKKYSGQKAICIVPAICFDKAAYRIGYGGGYYDRFIEKYPDNLYIGINYSCLIANDLPHGIYDKKVDIVVTENSSFPVHRAGKISKKY